MQIDVTRLAPITMLLAITVNAAAATTEPVVSTLAPEVLTGDAASTWEGPQIVRADRAGNVYLLRADTLQVYPLTSADKLAEPQQLEVTGELPQLVRNAALSPGGNVWLLSVDLTLRRFVDAKEKVVPALDWRISGLGFLRDEPLVSFLPLPVAWDQVYRERQGRIPRLMTFDGNRWNVLAEYPNLPASEVFEKRPDLNGALSEHSAFVAADREGRLWIARQYAYDVEQLTTSGKQRIHLVVNGGKVEERKADGEAKDRPAGLTAFRSQAAILDLVEGRDHRMYFLATGSGADGGLVLDRYDPVTSELQRVSLTLRLPGRATLAAGKKGLYLAAWNGRGGRWFLSWDALELAGWRPVPNAEIFPSPPKSPPATN